MLYLLVWWVLLLLLGFAALPLTMRFLRFLPDRGYAFAKPLALLVWVYPFWLLGALGFLQNSFGALAVILVVLAVASWTLLRGVGEDSVLAWLRAHWRYALFVEIVFGAAYLAFAYFRAFNPEIAATEKPMEFMFLNSILSSATFPPHDAWLSGYAISYYYLGYVIVAALAKLGNIPSAYAFNLGLIMTFALAAVGAFGLSFNVVSYAQTSDEDRPKQPSRAPYVFGVIAVFLLLVIGNLEGVLETTYNAKIGSREFYAELNLHGLEDVQPSGTFIPEDNWWWWRASRVLNDKAPVGGGHIEVIDEFPAFSFLLGDLHPHVLALPFGILALAVAFHLLLKPTRAISNAQDAFQEFFTPQTLLTVLVVGALGMLNTWDIVTYGVVIAAAFAISQYRALGKFSAWLLASSILFLVLLFVGGYILFLPFYLGFASQARGILPNIFSRTPLHQYLIMWGMFVFAIATFVGVLFWQLRDKRRAAREWFEFALPLLAVPFVIALLGAIVLFLIPSLRELLANALQTNPQNATASVLGAFGFSFVASPGTFLLLVVLIAGIAALGYIMLTRSEGAATNAQRTAIVFALLLALVGFILTFGVEFLFIRDTFETRMNTVFKLYYQAWLLLALASAFGAFYIWQTTRGAGRTLWLAAFGVMFALSMIYPTLAFPNRANYFQATETTPTLDGWSWVRRSFPDDYAAIEWARANIPSNAVILESVGDQYSFDNRVSVATGLPTVLGWSGHELQWRGNSTEADPRARDVEQIYKTRDVEQARELLEKYNVSYVFVGDIERGKYNLNQAAVDKFAKLGEMVFEKGSMRIYRVGQVSVSINAPQAP